MNPLLKCSRGHEWELRPESPVAERTVCPTCGATVELSNDDPSATFSYQPSSELSGDNRMDDELDSRSSTSHAAHQIPGYEVLEELGRGAMGVVYRARQIGLNRLVALKMVLSGSHAGAEELARFRAEAEAVARLQHPGIVQIYEIGEHDGRPYFALEFVDGGSLSQKLNGAPLPTTQAAQLAESLARGVQYAHEHGVIHRDLKPANILLSGKWTAGAGVEGNRTEGNEGNADRTEKERSSSRSRRSSSRTSSLTSLPSVQSLVPKIADFGLAKQLDVDSGQTRTGAIVGTPSYMAPEQAAGLSKDIAPAADIYSLGAILYEMLTGRPPFRAATMLQTLEQVRSQEPVAPSRLQPGLPRDLETICLKCLPKEPAKRYESAAALADDLARFLRGEPITARPVSTTERVWRWAKRKPLLAGLYATVAALLLLVVIVSSVLAIRLNIARRDANFASKQSDLNARRATAEATRASDEAANAVAQKQIAEQNEGQAKTQQARAEAEERLARRRLYAAQMNLAQQSREEGKLARVLELLETQRPRFDEDDLRGFEWYHLWDVCCRARLNEWQCDSISLDLEASHAGR